MSIEKRIVNAYILNTETERFSKEISRERSASKQVRQLASPCLLKAVVTSSIDIHAFSPTELWGRVRGILGKFKSLLKIPRIVAALKGFLGDITPDALKKFIEEGKKSLVKVLSPLKPLLTTKGGIKTLTDLVKRTVIGAKMQKFFHAQVKPRADAVDAFLTKHIPTLRKVLLAGIFAFIWLNVDELSWEPSGLIMGFTGQISLADLLASLPESAFGFLTGKLLGIGYVIMPYVLAARLLWLASQKYVEWNGGWQPNWSKVDKALFNNAHKDPDYALIGN